MNKLFRVLFRIYSVFISPALLYAFGVQCRYEESCSRYMERAMYEKGLFRGFLIGTKRILSCTSWNNRSNHG